MSKIDVIETEGKVIEVLPKTQFKVQLTNGHVILAYLEASSVSTTSEYSKATESKSKCRPTT